MSITTTLRHKRTVAVWMALALGFSSTAIQAQNSLTAGTFAVNDAGAATYSIPLTVAPAAGDLVPKLSLQYSSQAANGVFGVGWTLAGVSSITRCAKTPAEEGDRIGVKNDASDVFCLDGQKLRVTNGGAYGAAGTQYRTAMDTYGRITSLGTAAGGGPMAFTLETKTGEIYTFGSTVAGKEGSWLEYPGKNVVRTWMVSEIKDRFNNSIAFTYAKDLTRGEQLLTQVDYNNGQIKLNYEARPPNDQILKYDDGIQYGSTNSRVASITVAHKPLVGGTPTLTPFKTYQLQYTQSQASQRSMLRSVRECAPDGACLPAISLSYRDGIAGVFQQGPAFGMVPTSNGYKYGLRDANASGKQSVYQFRNPSLGSDYRDIALWDVDGDGRTDYLAQKTVDENTPLQEVIQYASGAETSNPWDYFNHIQCFADINGDGRSEPIRFRLVGVSDAEPGQYAVAEPIGNTAIELGTDALESCKPVDIDGDGRSEVLVFRGNGVSYLLTYKAGAWSKLQNAPALGYSHNSLGDFNGDGKTDWLTGNRVFPSAASSAFLSNGTGSAGIAAWTTQPGGVVCNGDFNGDGRTDTLSAQSKLYLSNGLTATMVSHNVLASPSGLIACGDFNGDGLMDIATSAFYWYNLLPADVDRLITVDNGAGFVQMMEYKSITDGSVYTKGAGAVYPQIDMQTPIMVVSRVRQSSNDPQKWQNTGYQYAYLRADLKRSGTQGFGRVTSFNETSGVNVATDYNQAYPLTGLRAQVRKFVGSEVAPQTLELTTYGYLQRGIGGPAPTAQAAQVHLNQTITEQYDLLRPGMRIGKVSTAAEGFDDYGYPRTERVEHFDGALNLTSRSTSIHDYQHRPTNWLLGQLVKTTTSQDNLLALGSVSVGGAPTAPPGPPPPPPALLSPAQLSALMAPIFELLLADD